jgi:hypothetical protein
MVKVHCLSVDLVFGDLFICFGLPLYIMGLELAFNQSKFSSSYTLEACDSFITY